MDDDKNVFPLNKIPSNKTKAAQKTMPHVASGPSQAREREFIEHAKTHSLPTPDARVDWKSLDPEERPTRGINVRFNEYELALLRHIAKTQGRSIHQVIKRLLVPAARSALEE